MTPLRKKMIEAMQLRGLADSTQQSYLRRVTALATDAFSGPDTSGWGSIVSWLPPRPEECGVFPGFQGRRGSCVMDDQPFVRAVRYVEFNPVSAGIVPKPEEYPWSSDRLHLSWPKTDPLNADHRVVELIGDWRAFLREGVSEEDEELERHLSTGRPWAD